MITIVCGEDSISSRNYFTLLKKQYQQKEYETKTLSPGQITSPKLLNEENLSLFTNKTIYFSENLYLKKTKTISDILANKKITLIDWEDGLSGRDIRLGKNSQVKIKEFKPSENIFKLLDSCYPTNRKNFLQLLHSLSNRADNFFVFLMFIKHIRKLIIIKTGKKPSKLADWQIYKLKTQTASWKTENLVNFYEALQRIDVMTKTSRNPYSLLESLDILSVYFL
jgi:hypothetical protein